MAVCIAKLVVVSLLFISTVSVSANSHTFARSLLARELGLKKEKLSHLHFYFHDIVSGPNPTAVRVAEAKMTNTSATGFGAVVMIDDPLTEGPEMSSKEVGRAQGIYALASQNDVGLLMVQNYVFTEGKYNGSTLSVLGRNAVLSSMRELTIVGGSGLFRFARGYAQAKTRTLDLMTGDACVDQPQARDELALGGQGSTSQNSGMVKLNGKLEPHRPQVGLHLTKSGEVKLAQG
ncbi:hypothetical protein NL676_016767, partial [Syzygium grande]